MKGYKHTDIGIIPKEWEVKTLGEVGSFSKGKGIKKDEVVSDGIPCIRYGEIYTKHNEYIKNFTTFITKEISKNSFQIKKGDILFAGSGETKVEIGKCVAFVFENETYAGGDIIILSPKNLDSLFLGFLLNHSRIQKQKAQNAQGDAVVHIYANALSKIKIPIPPLPEQQAIAQALSNTDALITNLQNLIAKKRLIKQGAMQELLTPKKGWEVKKLGEVAISISSGKSFTQSQSGKYPIYGSTGIIGWNSFSDYEGSKILIARVGANAGTVNIVDGSYCVSDNTLMISLKSKIDLKFIYFVLLKFGLNKLVFGSGQPLITGGQLKEIEIQLPTEKEQTHIATILTDMDNEINSLEQKLEKYKSIKQGMMQDLLTGKVRLV